MDESGKPVGASTLGFKWDEAKGFEAFGRDAIVFWKNPSLLSILKPLREEVGDQLYALLIAHAAAGGTYEDYHSMIMVPGRPFEEGFLDWGKAVSRAGWGRFSLRSVDWEKKEAVVIIDDPWEMKIFKSQFPQDEAPFLCGKISGIFSYAFQVNCRTEVQQAYFCEDGHNRITLAVRPSIKTLEAELNDLQKKRSLSGQTELRIANEALRRNQQRHRDVLEFMSGVIWESNEGLVLSYFSDLSSKLMRLPDGRILGRSLLDFVAPGSVSTLQEAVDEVKSGRKLTAEATVQMRSGGKRPYWGYFKMKSLRDIAGNPNGFLGVLVDITLQTELRLELEREQGKSVESAKMASLGEMAAGIAHEINNPLAVMTGKAWQLKKTLETRALEEIDHTALCNDLALIETTGKRIAQIIKGMRSFVRNSESDPFTLSSASSLVEETLVFCQARMSNHGIEMKVELPCPNLMLECRPAQVGQILLNLLNNSFDAVLPLSEKWIELRVSDRGDSVEFQVTDSGGGIPVPIRTKIMQPFFTTKDPGKGTGLGLSISQGIVRAHGGSLSVDETSSHTRFVLILPKKQARAVA